MSELTAKMRANFSAAILDAAPFSLGAREAALLASFTLMKAIVKNYGYANDEAFFTRAASERLRTSKVIPPAVKMWFAAYQGASRYAFHSTFHTVSTSEPGLLEGMEFFSYTYVCGNLALQLLAPRWKDMRDRSRPLLTLKPNLYWKPATTQFWPYSGEALQWPPEKYLGDRLIKHFVYRFQSPITLRS